MQTRIMLGLEGILNLRGFLDLERELGIVYFKNGIEQKVGMRREVIMGSWYFYVEPKL